MIAFIVRRLVASIAVIFAVASASFLLLHAAPGGPFDTDQPRSAAVRTALAARYGLDEPLGAQYLHELGSLARGDLGHSIKRDVSVGELIRRHAPVSAALGAIALAGALGLGLVMGLAAAWRRNTRVDYGLMTIALVGISVPSFVIGPILISAFALRLGWLPPARIDGPAGYVLPALALGLVYLGTIARLARGGMIEALEQDFVRTARAKGLPDRVVLWKHALRVGVQPVVTYLGPATAALISGSFVVEKIFQVPGLGASFVDSIAERDYPVLTGVFVFYAVLLVLLNLIVDLAYGWLDPRVRAR